MTRLEDLKPGASVKGILPDALVTLEIVRLASVPQESADPDGLDAPPVGYINFAWVHQR